MDTRNTRARALAPLLLAAALAAGAAQATDTTAKPSATPVIVDEEVPFITTPDNVTQEMLRIAGVGPRDHVIDLGSGDGRIVITAARRFGATGLGVEIVPELVDKSVRYAREAGVADKAQFKVQDLFATDLSPATVVTMYLLPQVNLQLRPRLLQLKPGTRVVSHDWDMGDWQPDRTTVVPVPDKAVGREKSSKVHLWIVPARVDGLWCGTGLLKGSSMRLAQQYQAFSGTLNHRNRERPITGRMEGGLLRTDAGRYGTLELAVDGGEMRLAQATGMLALARGTTLQKAAGNTCT